MSKLKPHARRRRRKFLSEKRAWEVIHSQLVPGDDEAGEYLRYLGICGFIQEMTWSGDISGKVENKMYSRLYSLARRRRVPLDEDGAPTDYLWTTGVHGNKARARWIKRLLGRI